MADINDLPSEVLVQIFHYYLQTDTQLNFINCVSHVCKKWKAVCMNSVFFETLDGSLSVRLLVDLAKVGSLQRTKTLKFSESKKRVKKDQYKNIYTNMPRLKHLNLTGLCHLFQKKKEHPVITELEGLCPDLCELVLSDSEANFQDPILNSIVEPIILIRGHNLVMLNFSFLPLPLIHKLFIQIADNCPNLEELLAQYLEGKTPGHIFPIEKMQKGCPKLKTLRLGHPIAFSKKSYKDALGFPNLEIFTHPSREDYNFKTSDVEILLFKSPDLKVLDVRGCPLLTYESIHSLPALDLEQIYISFTRIANSGGVSKIIQKWSHSLNVIDVSHMVGEHINTIFLPSHLPYGLPNLEVLDVNSTAITVETVEIVLQQCPKLRWLNLEACRSMKRGTRNNYRTRSEIEKLKLHPIVMDYV